jgi:hypothetical protein
VSETWAQVLDVIRTYWYIILIFPTVIVYQRNMVPKDRLAIETWARSHGLLLKSIKSTVWTGPFTWQWLQRTGARIYYIVVEDTHQTERAAWVRLPMFYVDGMEALEVRWKDDAA